MLRNDALDLNLQMGLDEFWQTVAGGQPGVFAVVVKFQFAVCCQIPICSWLSNSNLQLVVKFQFTVGCQIPICSLLSNSYLQEHICL